MIDPRDLFGHWAPADYIAPDDLLPGDLLPVTSNDGEVQFLVAVLALEPAFNPQFRPIRFSDDPHYAMDFWRASDVLACRWTHHGERDMLGRDLTDIARCAGIAA